MRKNDALYRREYAVWIYRKIKHSIGHVILKDNIHAFIYGNYENINGDKYI